MAETDRRRLITSTPHLSPDEVVQRSFTTSFRGYSESEVRAFLKRISEDLVLTREREAELVGVIDSLEEQLRAPRPLNEPEMLDALGAETTRLLRSAREAAEEIRAKGEERAAQLTEQAREEAERLTTETEATARALQEDAEARASSLVNEAEARAAEARSELEAYSASERERAEHEAAEIVEAARQQGREMLDEAKSTRERVLADLFRRRTLLQSQIEELRGGRDNLLDAYRVVKRTFLEATNALAQVEARAAADRITRENDPGAADTSAEMADSIGAIDPDVDEPTQLITAIDLGTTTTASDAPPSAPDATDTDTDTDADPNLADVDSLFARIRAGHTEPADEPGGDGVDATDAAGTSISTTVVTESREAAEGMASGPDADGMASDGTVAAADPEPEESGPTEPDGIASWRSRRTEFLEPLISSVAKRAKRAAQDDQNALLDAVRRHKGRPTSAQVLVPEADLLATWVTVMQESLDDAYAAGRSMAGGDPNPADAALAREAAATIVLPVRERIAAAIDAGEDGDTGGLVERIGARFREWKNQSLEDALVDALALAWSRGVYDASPDGAVLQWIPVVDGRCADCDDNGLEPTVKGSSFPTGQLHPPAHPGCRCLLAPTELLGQFAASA